MPAASDTYDDALLGLPSYDLGIVSYRCTSLLQGHLRRAVIEHRMNGALLLLEHHAVVTLGAHAPTTDLLDPMKAAGRMVDVVRSERGGRATLHAPGQLVVYPVLTIPRRDLRGYVRDLEEILLRMLARAGLKAERRPGKPGLFVGTMKIASLGLRCEHGVASHGCSLNVDLDLSLFDLITSCGEPALRQTSVVRETGRPFSIAYAKRLYLDAFSEIFDRPVWPLQTATCDDLLAALT